MAAPIPGTPIPPPNLNRPRLFGDEADDHVEIAGLKSNFSADAYSLLLQASWWTIIVGFVVAILLTNLVFAGVFLLVGGVANVAPGSFRDAFFFSVQTLSTLGYGQMYPSSTGAEVTILVESMVSLLETTLVTGLVFAKFSRPIARVMFSSPAVISNVDGIPTLQFRAANARGNHIVDAQASLVLIRWEQTAEGKSLYRMHDLELVRSRSQAFKNTWLVMHRITERSPLHGVAAESALALDLELAVTLMGTDGTTSQTIHASHSYTADELRFGERFLDMLEDLPEGRLRVNYANFNLTEKAASS
jgi:inward rectifier potassium channel